VAADKFKGALDAPGVCAAIRRGVYEAAPEAEVVTCPMADGGEGTAQTLAAGSGQIIQADVHGPLPGRRVTGEIAMLDDGTTAVLDMATAAGFALLRPDERDPMRTTTFGVGELICHAIDQGAKHVIVGLGGSATCDAGLGAAQALGLEVELDEGPIDRPLTGADLSRLRSLTPPMIAARARITCLCDVDNPLFGPRGSARVFATQKGATPDAVDRLDAGLRRAAELLDRNGLANEPGMGAAGGLAFGLSMVGRCELRPGVHAVADAVRLRQKLDGARLCFTGEGRFDSQSLGGKVPAGVADLCRVADVPCVVLAGAVTPEAVRQASHRGIDGVFSISDGPATLETVLPHTGDALARTAEQVVRLVLTYSERPTSG
jgi:glycerate kinase